LAGQYNNWLAFELLEAGFHGSEIRIFFHFVRSSHIWKGIRRPIDAKRDKMTKKPNENDVVFIQALAELLSSQDLTEIEVNRLYGEDNSLNVRISKAQNVTHMTAALAAPLATAAPAAPAPAPAAEAPAAIEDPAAHPGAVTSPMVGTVYLQAEPGSPPFITVGAKVSEGDTILIIEAMKTMNQIPAPKAGTVTRILVEDSAAVEFGSPLVIIE
jgi:acetyl-CoA carboxylase biotin carboxyl carrier protein